MSFWDQKMAFFWPSLVFLCILVQETSRKLRRGPVLSRFWCFSRFSSVGGRLFLAIPCFPIARTHIWAPLCSSPYRIVTNLYTINIEFYQLFQDLCFTLLNHGLQEATNCPEDSRKSWKLSPYHSQEPEWTIKEVKKVKTAWREHERQSDGPLHRTFAKWSSEEW